MDTIYPSLDHTNLTEQTYKVLRGKILKRQLKPGEKIAVDEVAGALSVSRTPVITALQKLASEGLVEIVPQRGTFVTQLTTRDVAELSETRMMIELYAAESILKAGKTAQFLEDVRECMAAMEQATVNGDYRDYEAFITGDRDLHLALVNLTENQRLIEIYSNLNVHMQVARAHYLNSVENARQAQTEHEEVISALKNGKPDEVREALRTHISNVKARILEILDERGGKL